MVVYSEMATTPSPNTQHTPPDVANDIGTDHAQTARNTRVMQRQSVNEELSARGLFKRYGKKHAVNNLSLTIRRGEAVGLLGPNGAGKTTTFYLLAGLLDADAGSIIIDGVNVSGMPVYQRARHGLAYLPQEMSIFRELSVADNIMAILEISEKSVLRRQQRLETLLQQFRLEHLHDAVAISLSGGERRKLEIARLMATNPHYVLMDEPLAGVDPLAISEIRKRINDLCSLGVGVCITDHNVRDTLSIVNRAYIVHDGQVLREGTPAEIAQDEDVRRVYLGEQFIL